MFKRERIIGNKSADEIKKKKEKDVKIPDGYVLDRESFLVPYKRWLEGKKEEKPGRQ